MPLPPQLFDITVNCTNLMNMTQQERVAEITSQPVIMIPFLVIYFLLGIVLFIFGFTSVGKSEKMLITLPNYFFIFIPYLLAGGLIVYLLHSATWILPFI